MTANPAMRRTVFAGQAFKGLAKFMAAGAIAAPCIEKVAG